MKLIVTDIDGTLVPENTRALKEEYFDVIRALTDCGIIFVAASGRHSSNLKKLFAPVADRIGFLSQNGSVAEYGGEKLIPYPLPKEWPPELLQEMQKEGCEGVAVCSGTYCYVPYEDTQIYKMLDEIYMYDLIPLNGWGNLPEDVDYTMMTIFHHEDAGHWCEQHLDPKWQDRMQVMSTGNYWVDMIDFRNGKGSALKVLCEKLSIDRQDVIAFGDNLNDVSMIEYAGTGIAVENAKDPVKAAADRIIPGYAEDGVLKELKKILGSLHS